MWKVVVFLTLTIATASNEQCKEVECLLANQAKLEARLASMEKLFERASATGARRLLSGEQSDAMAMLTSLKGPVCENNICEIMPLQDILNDLLTKFGDLGICLDYMWLLVAGALVAFMQAGFAILECGAVRFKNAGTVLMKNVLDVCVGTIIWYFIGYGLAYGISDDPNTFIGTQNFAGGDFMQTDADGGIIGTSHFRDWFFQWAFCATAATIVSGGVAGRIRLPAYFIYTSVMTGLIYPVIVYWTWSGEGFLTAETYTDFAGSGIVHLTGGVGALVGAAFLGPREGRWTSDPRRFDPHNMGFVVLGTFVLWFGWYGFNCGSTLGFSDTGTATVAALVAVNTTMAAASGGITLFLARFAVQRKYDLPASCNGILVGLVAVCAGCDVYTPGMTLLVGVLGAIAHEIGHYTLQRLRIDDPLDAFSVHGCGGITGVLLRPLLDHKGADGKMFGAHCLAIACIVGWSGGISVIVFGAFKVLGKLTLSLEDQKMGTDLAEIGQSVCNTGTEHPIRDDAAPNQTEVIAKSNAADQPVYELGTVTSETTI